MNDLRVWLAVLLLALHAVAAGQEPEQADGTAPPPAEADHTPDEESFDIDEDWELPEIPAGIFGDDVFIPSEEIAADEEVVFPVDI
jgi:hypothetical protein